METFELPVMAANDSSLSLAPRRTFSLSAKTRPKTASGLPQEHIRALKAARRHSGMDFFVSTPETFTDFFTGDSYQGDSGMGAGVEEQEQIITTASRRSQTLGQSIKHGVSELKSIGRRMSVSLRGGGSRRKHILDTSQSNSPSLSEPSQSSFEDRPKSRGWFVRTPSARRRPSLPLLNFTNTEPNTLRYTIMGPIPGSATRPPILPNGGLGGADARAAAAAHNEAFHATRTPPLPPLNPEQKRMSDPRVFRDSESGIGISLESHSRRVSQNVDSDISRHDPADVIATELMENIMALLDPSALMKAASVSHRWRSLAHSQSVWRQIFLREYAPSKTVQEASRNMAFGLGKGTRNQDWRKLFKVRRLIDRRWQNGEAAAIYLNGHKDSVYCVQFDGHKIVTGSRDRTVRVWDARTYQCVRKLGPSDHTPHRNIPRRVEVEPNGVLPFCTIEYSSPDPSETQPLPLYHDQSILCLQFDDEIMVTGSSDFTCIVWSIKHNYRPMFRLDGHRAGVLDVRIDATRIVTCSKDSTIKVWCRYTGELLNSLEGHQGPVNAIQLRGNLLASASGDGMCRLWNLDDGNCVKEFSSQYRGLACVEFSEDGRYVFAGGNDQVIYEYDAQTGKTIRRMRGHSDLVRSLHLDTANGRVISGSYDASVKVWNSRASELRSPPKISFDGWTSSWILSAKSDYRKIVCTSQDGRVAIMDFGYGIDGVELLEP